jgi:hypothetical protein
LPSRQPVAAPEAPFWERKSLADLDRDQWESLCDGCGKCCLAKLEDPASATITYTNVACRLLDMDTCRCQRYSQRNHIVPSCEVLTPGNVARFRWLPPTCAYRRLREGRGLPWWHHLLSGDRDLVHRVGASACRRAVPAAAAGPLEHHIVTWPAEEGDC